MVNRENEFAAFGAEAMPGGLSEMNEAIRSHQPGADRIPPARAKAPLVGLIALAALWMRKHGERR
jgi:hypothetical protein